MQRYCSAEVRRWRCAELAEGLHMQRSCRGRAYADVEVRSLCRCGDAEVQSLVQRWGAVHAELCSACGCAAVRLVRACRGSTHVLRLWSSAEPMRMWSCGASADAEVQRSRGSMKKTMSEVWIWASAMRWNVQWVYWPCWSLCSIGMQLCGGGGAAEVQRCEAHENAEVRSFEGTFPLQFLSYNWSRFAVLHRVLL